MILLIIIQDDLFKIHKLDYFEYIQGVEEHQIWKLYIIILKYIQYNKILY